MSTGTVGSHIERQQPMPRQLTLIERGQFDVIPANQTKQITGGPNESLPCWKWALHGDSAAYTDPAHMFAVINAGVVGDPFGLLADELAEVPGGFGGSRTWTDRQRTKVLSGGKYTENYMVDKVVKRLVKKAGLSIVPAGGTNYKLCMHAPLADHITYEHWWLEIRSAASVWYTVEKIPSWHGCHIYIRSPDPGHYRTVRYFISGIQDAQRTAIQNILNNGTYIPTPPGGWS
jgi:hypothetical protein